MLRHALFLLPIALSLAACDGKSGRNVLIDMRGGSGGTQVSLDLKGIKALIELPMNEIEPDDIDMGGVKLYPGSTIDHLDIRANGGVANARGAVEVHFTAPADPATVRTHFLEAMKAKAFAIKSDTQGISGKDEDGDPVRITLTAGEGGKTRGTIAMTDVK